MPPKRKPEVVAEPSPPTKKRSSKSTATASEKKRAREEPAEATEKKGRRKKKLEEVEEEEEQTPSTPVATTPKQKKTPKQAATTPKSIQKESRLPSPPVTALKSATKPRSSRKSIVRIDLPPEPSSGKKSTSSSPIAASVTTTSAKTRTPLRAHTTPVSAMDVSAAQSGPDDEKEIVSLWNQTSGALHMSLSMIGPPFFFIILACYFMGNIGNKSQAIASVGVVYTFLFMTIMGSYALVILPCILVSRLFTCLVGGNSCHCAAEVNLYARLLVFFAAAAGMAYYYLGHHLHM